MIFRITKQTALVIEESYDVEANNADEAEDKFRDELDSGEGMRAIHTETINRHWEIVGTEEVTHGP